MQGRAGNNLPARCKCKSGEITKDTYDEWRYNYPKYDTTRIWAKVSSQELSDAMVEAFKDKLKDM